MAKQLSAAMGAYGLRLAGAEDAHRFLLPAPSDWPVVEIARSVRKLDPVTYSLDDQRAEMTVSNGGRIQVERLPARVTFTMPEPLRPEELLHPYLGYAASIFHRWAGRVSFHAGAAVVGDGVWGLLGERESGKSSTLAWLALAGFGVLCDDMLVLDRTTAFAGPRLVDLRPATASLLEVGEALGVVGTRERFRLGLNGVEPELPLKGFVFLAWGPRVELARVSVPERLLRLTSELSLRRVPTNPGALVELAGLPFWELRRPHGLDSLEAAGRRLLDELGT